MAAKKPFRNMPVNRNLAPAKICALNFEICPTYFDASAKVMKILHYKIVCIWSVFSKSVDELPANYCKLFCITLDFIYI